MHGDDGESPVGGAQLTSEQVQTAAESWYDGFVAKNTAG
jgi:hypothetical protein